MITFNNIPTQIGVPGAYVEFDGSNARRTPTAKPSRVLVFGQKNGGNAMTNVPILVGSKDIAQVYFGNSLLTETLKTFIESNRGLNEVWAIAQEDDAAGTAAEYTVTYTGTSTEAGTEVLFIGDSEFRAVVTAGMTAAQIAAAMVADISGLYAATAAGGVITIKFAHKGESGNDLQLYQNYDGTQKTYFTVEIAQTVQGAGNPSVADALAATQEMAYTDIVTYYNDDSNLDLFEAELLDRWQPLPNENSAGQGQNDAHLWAAARGTFADLVDYVGVPLQNRKRNSQHVTIMAVEDFVNVDGVKYVGMPSPIWKVAACYAGHGIARSSITPNANLQNIIMSCLKPAPRVSRFTWHERNKFILNYGLATYKYEGGDSVILERATTTMVQTSAGALTDAEMDTETQKLNSYFRWSLRNFILAKYPNHRLANDGPKVSTGADVTTPLRIKAAILTLADFWAERGFLEDYENFRATLTVERSSTDCNTVNASLEPDHINQFRVFAARIGYIVC